MNPQVSKLESLHNRDKKKRRKKLRSTRRGWLHSRKSQAWLASDPVDLIGVSLTLVSWQTQRKLRTKAKVGPLTSKMTNRMSWYPNSRKVRNLKIRFLRSRPRLPVAISAKMSRPRASAPIRKSCPKNKWRSTFLRSQRL